MEKAIYYLLLMAAVIFSVLSLIWICTSVYGYCEKRKKNQDYLRRLNDANNAATTYVVYM